MVIKLTQRERQIAGLLLQAKHTKEIASELDMSVRAVKSHLAHMYSKAHIEDGIKMIKLAVLLDQQFEQEKYWQQP